MVALFVKLGCSVMSFGCRFMIFSGFGMAGARHVNLLFQS